MNETALLTALRTAMQSPSGDGGFTLRELADSLQSGIEPARTALKKLLSQGDAVPGKGFRMAMDGNSRTVPVYRLVEKPKAKRGK